MEYVLLLLLRFFFFISHPRAFQLAKVFFFFPDNNLTEKSHCMGFIILRSSINNVFCKPKLWVPPRDFDDDEFCRSCCGVDIEVKELNIRTNTGGFRFHNNRPRCISVILSQRKFL
ncbi:hypothetical protein CEXT_366811 [Caerostris extrusa]|uniref:Secreted protein n=1 Tax=Caerostris extrusa TaxID=172846 RepID=A0AAV4W6J5_CAEEX|nr:hypothetical protein CEXT_366811 [Caerostris extrusa]